MDTFLDLNGDKLKFAFTRTSLVFLGVVSVFLTIAYFTENFLDAELLLIIVFTAGIGLPLIIILNAYLAWLYKRSARKKAFSKTPFDQIEKIGFYKSPSNVTTKWFFTHQVKEGHVNGFTLVCDISNEKSHIIEVKVPTEWKKLNKSQYNSLSKKFSEQKIEFRIGSLVKQYNTKRPPVLTIHDLKSDLEQFTELLKQEGFEPKKAQGSA